MDWNEENAEGQALSTLKMTPYSFSTRRSLLMSRAFLSGIGLNIFCARTPHAGAHAPGYRSSQPSCILFAYRAAADHADATRRPIFTRTISS